MSSSYCSRALNLVVAAQLPRFSLEIRLTAEHAPEERLFLKWTCTCVHQSELL